MAASQCPPSEELSAFLQVPGPRWERERLELHLSCCRDCRGRLVGLYEQTRSTAQAARWLRGRVAAWRRAPAAGVAPRPRRAVWAWGAAVAAASVTALVLSVHRRGAAPHAPVATAVLRELHSVRSRPELITPSPRAAVEGARATFRWSPVPGASRYSLTVMSLSGDVLLEASTPEPTLTVDLLKRGLRAGQPAFWIVSARWPDGTVSESGVGRFVLDGGP